jgi:hypothetical protein
MCFELKHVRMGHKNFIFQNYKTEVAAVHRSCNVKVNKWHLMEAIPLCGNREVHIYLRLDTAKSSVVSDYI